MSLALIALISFMVSAFFSRDIAEYSNKTFIAFLGISNLTSLISGLKDKWFVVLSKNRGVALEKIENRFSFLYIMNVLINAALSTGAALYFYWMI